MHGAGPIAVLSGGESGTGVLGRLDTYGAQAGSEPRSNHGQKIKRPVTRSGWPASDLHFRGSGGGI
jgi:hypothetical protein